MDIPDKLLPCGKPEYLIPTSELRQRLSKLRRIISGYTQGKSDLTIKDVAEYTGITAGALLNHIRGHRNISEYCQGLLSMFFIEWDRGGIVKVKINDLWTVVRTGKHKAGTSLGEPPRPATHAAPVPAIHRIDWVTSTLKRRE